jgi:ABC transport system ATP-binding/permease protein
MNYLSVENLSKSYGIRQLFQNLQFGIEKGQKVALLARNGAGKTTLMNILSGKEAPDEGKVIYNKEVRVAYLEQNPALDFNKSVLENVLKSNNAMSRAIAMYEEALEKNLPLDKAMAEMEASNAWEYEAKMKQILGALDLHHWNTLAGQLSGGQQRRVALASVLVEEPDFLLLDEPTNHLDLDMIEWLENFLTRSHMTLFMITHDRYFLENITDEILELENGQLYKYKGNFSYYLEKKSEREALEAASQEKQMNLFRRELEWARKMPRARTVKSKSRMDRFQELKESVKRSPETQELSPEINMSRLGSKIVEFHKVKKHWGEKKVLNGWDYVFKTGEKVGLVGPNGAGKTTLLKLMTLNEEPDGGKVVIGDTVVMGYYRQNMGELKEGQRLIEAVRDIAEFIPLTKGRTISAAQMLERFLFPKPMHFQLVESLSGGERKRLQLLLILMKNPNFLILDEPTNDLDVFTLSALEEYLMAYPGCLIIVSHDRYFLDKLVDHLFVLDGQGNVRDIIGTYQQFKDHQSQEDSAKKGLNKEAEESEKPTVSSSTNKKFSFKEKYEWDQIEKRIPELEKLKSELEEKLQTVLDQHEALMATTAELAVVIEELNSLELRWLELSEKISG